MWKIISIYEQTKNIFLLAYMWLCKTTPQCDSCRVENFLLNDLLRYWPYVCYVDKPRHTACRISKQKWGKKLNFFVSGCFQSKEISQFRLFWLSGFGFIDFQPPTNEFPLMFKMLVNMFWIAERFGFMWVPFEFGSCNNFCLVFSLE